MCGAKLGAAHDPFGQPSDASSNNAATGKIAVGTTNLTNSNMYEVAGVAIAKDGDCWASATASLGTATLTYFKGCSGSVKLRRASAINIMAGLDIDGNGNPVSTGINGTLYVYKGCNPSCTLVGPVQDER